MTPRAALESGVLALQLDAPAGVIDKLLSYIELLGKWNRTYNLTAIEDPLEMATLHVPDSLAVMQHLPLTGEASLADIGSGGGLPGIPLAIARPQWRVTVNDSSSKKAAFLRQAAIELALPNLTVHEGRVEAWQPAQRFRLIISRAFAELAPFIAACRHLVAPGGWLAAMKGVYPRAEIEAASSGCECAVTALQVPFVAAERHLVLCRGFA
jgi:16S rRNA (guanine527-N7)-methyltransferase